MQISTKYTVVVLNKTTRGQKGYTAEELKALQNSEGTPLYVAELNAELKNKDVQISNLVADNQAIKKDNVEMKKELAELKALVAQLVAKK